jgi:ribonuclease HI
MAAEAVQASWPLKIITDSKYTINSLTTHLREWEDRGWIGIKNRKLFKKAAYTLKRRTAPTTFQWTKGHNGNIGNKESDCLTKEGAEREEPGELNIEIPKEFDLQGAKLAALTQAKAYRGILE